MFSHSSLNDGSGETNHKRHGVTVERSVVSRRRPPVFNHHHLTTFNMHSQKDEQRRKQFSVWLRKEQSESFSWGAGRVRKVRVEAWHLDGGI